MYFYMYPELEKNEEEARVRMNNRTRRFNLIGQGVAGKQDYVKE